ncbi:MAG: penicillin-insensitive murein endopeptidase [Myxococcota bacterium]
MSVVLRALAAAALLTSCASPTLLTDGTSVSVGTTSRGRTRSPKKMPLRGRGFVVPKRWKDRGFLWGVDEVVDSVAHIGARVRKTSFKAKLGVADLSRWRGGKASPWHSSHQSGRDVDLLFYSVDESGTVLPPPEHEMICYGDDGKAYVPERDKDGYADALWEQRRFDDRRNWLLVETLLTDPTVRVQWMFVSAGLESRMIRYARRAKRPRWIIEYARVVMRQPGDSLPHDDHFHVRVFCSRDDRIGGCIDRGPVWQHEKKTMKYAGPERYDPVAWRRVLSVRPVGLPH